MISQREIGALVGAFSMTTNLRMELFQALLEAVISSGPGIALTLLLSCWWFLSQLCGVQVV